MFRLKIYLNNYYFGKGMLALLGVVLLRQLVTNSDASRPAPHFGSSTASSRFVNIKQ